MKNQSVRWRALTAEEFASEPASRFGGAIAVIFFAAVLVTLPLPLLMLIGGFSPVEFFRDALTRSGKLLSDDMGELMVAYAVSQTLAMLAWGAVFIVVTIFRLRSGPLLAAILFTVSVLFDPMNSS